MSQHHIAPKSLSPSIKEFSQATHTLILLQDNYLQQGKKAGTFVDYHALRLFLTCGSTTSNAYIFTCPKYVHEKDQKSFLTELQRNQWVIKVVPEHYPYEHIMIRKALSQGMGSTFDSIILISNVSKMPEINQLRASGKHIIRCIFAKDVTQRIHKNADEVITLEELGVIY